MADDEPSWLKNPTAKSSGTSSPTPAPSASSASAAKSTAAVDTAGEPAYKNTVKYTFFILNLGMMVFLAATGVLGIQQSSGVDDTSVVFVGIYLILFAAIVFLYEVAQMCPESSIDIFFKKNFGFLYGVIGKSLFILFMGILAFGLSKPQTLAIACGVVVSAWGPAQILVYLRFPLYFDKKEKYQP